MTPKSQHTPVAMLNVVVLIVAAGGIMIQYVSGADYPTIPRRAVQAGRPGICGGNPVFPRHA